MGKGTNFSGCAHQGFFDYFIAGISDGSIRHGDNSDYSSGTVVVWKAPRQTQRGQEPLCPTTAAMHRCIFLLTSDGISSAETSGVKSKQSKYRDLSLEIMKFTCQIHLIFS